MTDHLRMRGKDALTIEEAEAIVYGTIKMPRALRKILVALNAAKSRRDTREGMRKQGAAAAQKAGYTSEQLREEASKAGVKIKPEGR